MNLPRHIDERIIRRLIAIAGRENRGPLNVRGVVGRTGGGVEHLDGEFVAQRDERVRLGEINLGRVALVHAEAVAIRQARGEILRDARPELARLRAVGVGTMRNHVEQAETNAEIDRVPAGANARHDLPQHTGAVFKTAAVFSGPRVRAKKLVQQITVAVLEIHEIRAYFPGDARRAHVVGDEFLHLRVAQHLIVAGDVELLVENGMPKRDA